MPRCAPFAACVPPAVKRILKEFKDLQDEPSDDFVACPLEVRLAHVPQSAVTGRVY